jgi:hypothetical protein
MLKAILASDAPYVSGIGEKAFFLRTIKGPLKQ